MPSNHYEDRYEIEQLLYRYAWMADERQWELMDSVFSPEATIDYTSTGGKKGPYRPTLEWLDRALTDWPINLHFINNIHIEFTDSGANCRCYFLAPMGRNKGDGQQEVITNAGYYFDTLIKTDQGWRIKERLCKQTTMIGSLPEGYVIPG